jgi:hypothetical protein
MRPVAVKGPESERPRRLPGPHELYRDCAGQRFRAVARLREDGDLRRAVVDRPRAGDLRLRAEEDPRALVLRRAVLFFVLALRVAAFRVVALRVVALRLVALRFVALRLVALRLVGLEDPLACWTALVKLFRALLKCDWTSFTALRASPSTFEVAVLIRFSSDANDVLRLFSAALPPVERRAVFLFAAVFLDDAERPLALRLVLLRAVALRAPPVFLRTVLRAAGDIKLLSLGGRWGVYFIRRMPAQGATLCKYVE